MQTPPPSAATAAALFVPDVQPRWYALHTCSRHEKRVYDQLSAKGIQSFLPLYTSQRRWKDRKMSLDLPLFPGYMFVHIPFAERLRVLQLPGAVKFVSARGHAIPLDDSEIENLRRGLSAGGRAEPHPFLNIGQQVRIIAGPFAGATGILLRRKDDFRVVLSVNLIMRSVAIEVDACDIEPAGRA
jgi:transcription antitermination factor NusG